MADSLEYADDLAVIARTEGGLKDIVEDIFVPCCTKIWVPGNEFSMPRFVYAFAARVRARAESFAVWHTKRKHVRGNSLYSKHLTRSEFLVPARVIAYTNITHSVKSLLMGVVF